MPPQQGGWAVEESPKINAQGRLGMGKAGIPSPDSGKSWVWRSNFVILTKRPSSAGDPHSHAQAFEIMSHLYHYISAFVGIPPFLLGSPQRATAFILVLLASSLDTRHYLHSYSSTTLPSSPGPAPCQVLASSFPPPICPFCG